MRTHLDDEAIAALRAVYEAGEVCLHDIASTFHIGERRLAALALGGGWSRPVRIGKPKVPHYDPVALRLAYETAEKSISEICEDFGIGESTLTRLAALNDWVRSRRVVRKTALTAPKRIKAAEEQRVLITSLYDMLGTQIRALAGRGSDAQSGRELEQLVKCFKTINDLQAALGGPGAARHDGQNDERSADEIRAALLRRLAPRIAAGRADGASSKPE